MPLKATVAASIAAGAFYNFQDKISGLVVVKSLDDVDVPKKFVTFPSKKELEVSLRKNQFKVFVENTDILNITREQLTPHEVHEKVEKMVADFLKKMEEPIKARDHEINDQWLKDRKLKMLTILLQKDLAARKQLMIDGLYPSTLVKLPSKETVQDALAKHNLKFFMQHTDILTITDEQLTPDELYQKVDAIVTQFFEKWKDGFSVMKDMDDDKLRDYKQAILTALLQDDPYASRELHSKNLYSDLDGKRWGCRH